MATMTIPQIVNNLRKLPAEKLVEVNDFVSYLIEKQYGSKFEVNEVEAESAVAVILSPAEYEELKARGRWRAAFYELAYNLGQEVAERGLTEEEFLADVEKTKREVFAEQYGL